MRENNPKDTMSVVIQQDVTDHPNCRSHGPALLFSRGIQGQKAQQFFACSAVRDRNACPIVYDHKALLNDEELIQAYESRTNRQISIRQEIEESTTRLFGYCSKCQSLVEYSESSQHADHEGFQLDLPKEELKIPTRWLRPLDNDSKEAQYFFSDSTLACLADIFIRNIYSKIICVGAPRLYEYLKSNIERLKINTVLLDLDDRLEQFYDPTEYFRYNMFNNHFLDGQHRTKAFKEFLTIDGNENICLVTDPPFGCRTEPLVHTIKTISQWYQQQNQFARILSVVWIFPYFMDHYIQKEMPEMEMAAYHVNYTNHKTYHNGQNGRKQGSPIRLFTNIPLECIPLPAAEGYSLCKPCRRWVHEAERHCTVCAKCPSRNGIAYVHCVQCAICVKPNYRHCRECGRCTQVVGHRCEEYKRTLRCWICKISGHNEINCARWFRSHRGALLKYKQASKKTGHKKICFLCGRNGHNEIACPKRKALLNEKCFLNETVNIFSSFG